MLPYHTGETGTRIALQGKAILAAKGQTPGETEERTLTRVQVQMTVVVPPADRNSPLVISCHSLDELPRQ
jgi:hypothetical protein